MIPITESDPLMCAESNMKKMVNIGDAVPIIEYAEQEWRGDTPKAKTIKQVKSIYI